MLFLILFFQDDTYTESYISTIGVDFVSKILIILYLILNICVSIAIEVENNYFIINFSNNMEYKAIEMLRMRLFMKSYILWLKMLNICLINGFCATIVALMLMSYSFLCRK